jgi:hypothetical protein
MIDYATSAVVTGICGLAFTIIKLDLTSIKKRLENVVTEKACQTSRTSCENVTIERRRNIDSHYSNLCRKISEQKDRIDKVEINVHSLEIKVGNQ